MINCAKTPKTYSDHYKKPDHFGWPVERCLSWFRDNRIDLRRCRCLDVGCGQGQWAEAMGCIAGRIAIGIDPNIDDNTYLHAIIKMSTLEQFVGRCELKYDFVLLRAPSILNAKCLSSTKWVYETCKKVLTPRGRILHWVVSIPELQGTGKRKKKGSTWMHDRNEVDKTLLSCGFSVVGYYGYNIIEARKDG